MRHRMPPRLCIRQFWLQSSLVVLLSGITAESLKAQTPNAPQLPATPPPQDILPPAEPTEPQPQIPEPLPPPEELLTPPQTPTPPAPIPGKVPENITVKRFEVVGSTVFSPQELDSVLAPYTNKPISFTQLFQARSAITQLYIDRGYITSGALIPPQTLQGGIVKIQVVEGSLEAINVTGTRRLQQAYVRDRLPNSKPLNQKHLLEALQLLQLNPLIQNISAELAAGTRPGTSVLEVQVTEAKTFDTQLVADNGRSPSVGSFRRSVQFNEANLLGLGDGLNLAYSNTDGSDGLDVGYTLPVNSRNGTISLGYGTTSSTVIEPEFEFFGIDGDSRYYQLTLRQPLSQTPSQEFALGLTAARSESDISSSVLEDFGLPPAELSPGADEEGRTRISALQFFQEWTSRNASEVIAARSQFNLGIGAFNATVNEDAPDSRFFSWRGQAQWVRLLAPETLLLLRADVQLSPDDLVPLEQFGLGGIESVRGYRQDALLTDNGALVSAEFRFPIYRQLRRRLVVQLTPFVDFGTAWNSGTTNPDTNTLVSLGLGLRFQLGDRLTARLDWGIPLVDIPTRERTWQENGLYFSIVSSPF